jgi:S-adenosylmethionine synthetase
VIPRIRPGSSDLSQLFSKSKTAAASNDTSCCAGFAPLSALETAVLEVERHLNSAETKRIHPFIGADIKVMGVRRNTMIDLTISCAFVGRFVPDMDTYIAQKEIIRQLALAVAGRNTNLSFAAVVNGADDLTNGNLFLTVTGTSAEAGDDGEAGRGNRACGLITPYRVMTVEATAGKNPVSHVGKLYNLVAERLAARIVTEIAGISDAQCVLLSQIGRLVTDPSIVDIGIVHTHKTTSAAVRRHVQQIVQSEFDQIDGLRAELLAETVSLY